MDYSHWMMLIGVFLVFGVPAWPRVAMWWREKKRQERLDALVEERFSVMRHKDALAAFPKSNGGASEEDKAEAEVLCEQARERIRQLNREIAAVHMEGLRENDRKAIR